MYIDDDLIFVHNPRASGTSIRRVLLRGEDPNERDEKGGYKNVPTLPGVRFRGNKNIKHAFASQIAEALGPDAWAEKTSFAIVRNPWDRLVSLWHLFRRPWLDKRYSNKLLEQLGWTPVLSGKDHKKRFCRDAFRLPFHKWVFWAEEHKWIMLHYLNTGLPLHATPQHMWTDGVDHVFNFEDRRAINDFLEDMGYPIPPVENAIDRPKFPGDWKRYYDAAAYDWVARVYAEDIKRFGYGK